MTEIPASERHRVRRLPERGRYDRITIHGILDGASFCHVGIVEDGHPIVIPTLHARDGDTVLLHGASTSRLLRHVGAGHEVCITATLFDGLVLARSIFHHSVNYRSVVLTGRGRLLEGTAERLAALERFTERLLPGRWAEARPPNPQELKATAVAAIPIEGASAKVRSGPPGDDPADAELAVWSGVIPLRTVAGVPIPDAGAVRHPTPPSVLRYLEAHRP